MTAPLRLGYVGCGFMAQKVHLPNILATPGVELKALAELRPHLGEKVRRRLNVPVLVHDHRELAARGDLDAVAVSGHYAEQGEIAIDLLTAGKHVFLEKPMAVSVHQAQRILAAERSSGRRLMIAYMKRYDAGNRKVYALLEAARREGNFGPLNFVRNHGFGGEWIAGLDTPMDATDETIAAPPRAAQQWPDWLPVEHRNGYINYLQQYTHNVNLLRWFLGGTAENTTVTATDLGADGVSGVVLMRMAGVRCTIESGWLPGHTWDEHTQLFFGKGYIRTEALPLLLRNSCAGVEVYDATENEKRRTQVHPAERHQWCYAAEIRHFVDCLRSGEPFRSPAGDALHDVAILEAIYKAHVLAKQAEPAGV